jgi:O-methyltransferase
MRKTAKGLVDSVLVPAVSHTGPFRRLISYVGRSVSSDGYAALRARFILNGRESQWGSDTRREIVRRFEGIDRSLEAATSPTDGLFLAEAVLSMQARGDLVECGCFNGTSTAKLSILAKLIGRRLHVYDSFEGLPSEEGGFVKEYHTRRSSSRIGWRAGDYAAGLERVRRNIERLGEIEVCSFYKGWFNETLTDANLPSEISLAFVDVDMPGSARECIAAIWPRLANKGVYFSHDVAFINVLKAILDRKLWLDELKEYPPILFGAGFGLGDSSPHLGFFVKGQEADTDYINSITLEK